jgi:hypothetical protein
MRPFAGACNSVIRHGNSLMEIDAKTYATKGFMES